MARPLCYVAHPERNEARESAQRAAGGEIDPKGSRAISFVVSVGSLLGQSATALTDSNAHLVETWTDAKLLMPYNG